MEDRLIKWIYPHYTREMNEYPDKPFELKHIYNIEKDRYEVNENQCCYYSQITRHSECTHRNNCIFTNEDIWEVYDENISEIVLRIKEINKTIKDLEKINDAYLNGVITYHSLLNDYYIIGRTFTDEGKIKVSANVRKGFRNAIKVTIKNLQIELRDLNRKLFRAKRH